MTRADLLDIVRPLSAECDRDRDDNRRMEAQDAPQSCRGDECEGCDECDPTPRELDDATAELGRVLIVRGEGRMDLITVCDKCLQASCWQAIFMCQESTNAGTIQKTREELAALDLENPCYWKTDKELAEA